MTNVQLKRWYRRYNRLYFGGKLPRLTVRFEKMHLDFLGLSTSIGGKWVLIELSKEIKKWPRLARQILLHEMVHVSLPQTVMHGPRFEKQMLRLAKASAFKGLW